MNSEMQFLNTIISGSNEFNRFAFQFIQHFLIEKIHQHLPNYKMEQTQQTSKQFNLKQTFPSLSLQTEQNNFSELDYEYVPRSSQVSIKYFFTLLNKPINRLSSQHQVDSIKNIPLVCSYADMDFKMSPVIHQDWIRRLNTKKINMGYTLFGSASKDILLSNLKKKTYSNINSDHLLVISSMLSLYHIVITELTTLQDKILIFTPTYYRFLFTLNQEKRQIVEYELQTRRTLEDEIEFYIDFVKLNQIFEENKIKLIVFASPHNPTGRVWKKNELNQLAQLIKKHDCLIFSDDIFCECMQTPKQNYTSLLQFQGIHQNLIWASSFGKAFNCSGNSFSYAIVANPVIKQKIEHEIIKITLFPTISQMKLLESCFTVGEDWRVKTIKYILINYELLRKQLKRRQLKLELYTLESGFLAVIDFRAHKLSHTQIKTRLQAQNIFPTYLDDCFVNRQKESVSIVRINLAMNQSVLMEFIDRIQKSVQKAT